MGVEDDRSGHRFDSKRHVGVIAQEVKEVLPEVVDEIYDGKFLGVDYPALIPLLIEAVRELDERTTFVDHISSSDTGLKIMNGGFIKEDNKNRKRNLREGVDSSHMTSLDTTIISRAEFNDLKAKYENLLNLTKITKEDDNTAMKLMQEKWKMMEEQLAVQKEQLAELHRKL